MWSFTKKYIEKQIEKLPKCIDILNEYNICPCSEGFIIERIRLWVYDNGSSTEDCGTFILNSYGLPIVLKTKQECYDLIEHLKTPPERVK